MLKNILTLKKFWKIENFRNSKKQQKSFQKSHDSRDSSRNQQVFSPCAHTFAKLIWYFSHMPGILDYWVKQHSLIVQYICRLAKRSLGIRIVGRERKSLALHRGQWAFGQRRYAYKCTIWYCILINFIRYISFLPAEIYLKNVKIRMTPFSFSFPSVGFHFSFEGKALIFFKA